MEDLAAARDRARNEPDPASRRQLIEMAWGEDGMLPLPRGRFGKRDAISERAADVGTGFPVPVPTAAAPTRAPR